MTVAGWPGRRRRDDQVDEVVVDDHRRRLRIPRGREQAVVDDDVARHARDARGPHLPGEVLDAGQGILGRQGRAGNRVRVGVVEVRVVDRAVGLRPAAEAQVARAHEDEVPLELPALRRPTAYTGVVNVWSGPSRFHAADTENTLALDPGMNISAARIEWITSSVVASTSSSPQPACGTAASP